MNMNYFLMSSADLCGLRTSAIPCNCENFGSCQIDNYVDNNDFFHKMNYLFYDFFNFNLKSTHPNLSFLYS
jgi:hypothetical protein